MFDNRLEESMRQEKIAIVDSDDDFEASPPAKEAPKQRKLGPKIATDDDDTPIKQPKASKRPAKTLDSGSSEDEKPKKVSQ